MSEQNRMNGLEKEKMGVASKLQQIAQKIQEQGYGGEAVIVITITDAGFEQVTDEGGYLVGDVAIGQAATTPDSALYCKQIRDLIGTHLHDAESEAQASWD